MRRNGVVETGRDRTELARDAGFGRISLWSVLAGTLAAYGAFAVALPVVTAVASAAGVDTDLSANDWRVLGTGAGVTVAVTLFASYLFGGYTAGRAARRQGLVHGLAVFALSVAVAAGVGALVGALTDAADGDRLVANLRDLGVPTQADEWRRLATVAGLAALGAMLAGSLLGGWRGEGWHGRLLARAVDPEVGHESRLRRLAAEADDRHGAAEDRVRRARGPLEAPRSSRDTAVLAPPVDEATERVVVTREPLGDAATTTQTIHVDQLRGGAEGAAGSAEAGRDRS